ncbi:MAG: hypothetical protein LBS07_00525 [Prevotellaceae bacterium]|nr:hypothetical protein [Prevotellaceae bacterium]
MRKVILNVDIEEYPFFVKLIKSLDFVHMQDDAGDSKEDIAANLTQGFKELKLYRQGKLKTTSAKDFLNEL